MTHLQTRRQCTAQARTSVDGCTTVIYHCTYLLMVVLLLFTIILTSIMYDLFIQSQVFSLDRMTHVKWTSLGSFLKAYGALPPGNLGNDRSLGTDH